MTQADSGNTDEVSPFQHDRSLETVHWKNGDEMHDALHRFSGVFRALLLDLLDRPMSRHEMRDRIQRLTSGIILGPHRNKGQRRLEGDLEEALKADEVAWQGERYALTPRGKEMAAHMLDIIPRFVKWVFSTSQMN